VNVAVCSEHQHHAHASVALETTSVSEPVSRSVATSSYYCWTISPVHASTVPETTAILISFFSISHPRLTEAWLRHLYTTFWNNYAIWPTRTSLLTGGNRVLWCEVQAHVPPMPMFTIGHILISHSWLISTGHCYGTNRGVRIMSNGKQDWHLAAIIV